MSDVRDPERDQALPVVNDSPFIQDLVVDDLVERKAHGIRKYGTALQAHNGRDMLQDAYEEVLDLAVYLRGRLAEESSAAPVAPGGRFTTRSATGAVSTYEVSAGGVPFLVWIERS